MTDNIRVKVLYEKAYSTCVYASSSLRNLKDLEKQKEALKNHEKELTEIMRKLYKMGGYLIYLLGLKIL